MKRPMTDDDLTKMLEKLPAPPMAAGFAARAQRRAREAFEAAGAQAAGQGGAGRARPPRVARRLTATALASAVAVYLAWAVAFVNALAR
jgi:hypothetical protein